MLQSLRRSSAILSMFAFGALAACSVATETEPGPPPRDPVVYDASAETKSEVGIAKWGFEPFAEEGSKVFRGSDDENAMLVEIRQRLENRELEKTFTMTMTGAAASGSERIEYVAEWNDTATEIHWKQRVVENTFAKGTLAAKILARISPDAAALDVTPNGAFASGLTTRTGDLTQEPGSTTEQSGETVKEPTELIECCSDLTEDTSKMAALAASACALAEAGDDSLASGGNATTESLDIGTEGSLRPRELVIVDGKPQIKSPWSGPYHIVDNHCHHAAAKNASKTDGYIACHPTSSTTSYSGHTVNWAPDPTADGKAGSYCAYEPQSNGGTQASGRVCCWSGGGVSKAGQPLIDNQAAQDCVKKICGSQADFSGKTPPVAFPAGQKPLIPNDCASSSKEKGACNTCCTTYADDTIKRFGDPTKYEKQADKDRAERYRKQAEEYRKRCSTACTDAELVRQQEAAKKAQREKAKADAQQCLSSALGSKTSGAEAKETCKAAAKK